MSKNRTVSRALDILLFLSNIPHYPTLSEIALEMGIPKSTAFDILQTMLEKGFVAYDENRLKSFKLGLNCFKLSANYLNGTDFHKESRIVLSRMAEKFGKTVFLATLNQMNIVYLDKVAPVSDVSITATIGSARPAYCTALGKAMLAFQPEDKILSFFPKEPFPKFTKNTVTTVNQLINQLDQVKKNGYALDIGECDEDVHCVAVAVLNYTGLPVGAISISGRAQGMATLRETARVLKVESLELSQRLGYRLF